MYFIQTFEEITGKAAPQRVQQFFMKEEYKTLVGRNIKKPFKVILDDSDLDYRSLVLQMDFAKMEMLADWSNDGYYDEDTFVPLFTIMGQDTSFIAYNITTPYGSVYFFDKDTGFIDLELTLDEFIEKVRNL